MPDYESSPFSDPAPWAVAAPPPPPQAQTRAGQLYDLRPLSLGEILDRTFAIYRRRFWLYVGLSWIAALVPTISTFVQLSFLKPAGKATPDEITRELGMFAVVFLVTAIVALVAYSLTQAATVAAVSAEYIGEETSIGAALKTARKHWFRYVLITLWQGWSAGWLILLTYLLVIVIILLPALRDLWPVYVLLVLGSIVYGVIAYLRNSLGVVSATVEDLKVRAAMRRSKFLVSGHKGRVLGIWLLTIVLQMVASVTQGIAGYFVGVSHGVVRGVFEAIALVITFLSTAIVVPVAAIALCLFYIDERVRKEGFDLEVLLSRGATQPPPAPEELPSPFSSELV
jgi:hypothetical protein